MSPITTFPTTLVWALVIKGGTAWGLHGVRVASVWSGHGGQSATRLSRSKSEPPWARLTTWWDLEAGAHLFARGRLVITRRGAGHFTVEVTRGADKWAIRAQPTGRLYGLP